MSTLKHTDHVAIPLGKRGALEGVARRHGRRRNPARKLPRSSLRTPENQFRHSPQRWVEKRDRSVANSETPDPGSPIEDRSPVDIRLGPSWTPPFSAMMTPDEHRFVASSNLHDDEGCFPISTTGVSDLRGRPPRLDTTAPRSRTSSCPSTHSLNGPAPDEDSTARPWPEGDEAAQHRSNPAGRALARPARASIKSFDRRPRALQAVWPPATTQWSWHRGSADARRERGSR